MSRVILIKAHVITCYRCGAWLGRTPLIYGDGDKGDFCWKCGCTSVRVREGRPYGPRSRHWDWLSKEAEKLIDTFKDDDYMLTQLREELVWESQ